jgi:hypothetical protein
MLRSVLNPAWESAIYERRWLVHPSPDSERVQALADYDPYPARGNSFDSKGELIEIPAFILVEDNPSPAMPE